MCLSRDLQVRALVIMDELWGSYIQGVYTDLDIIQWADLNHSWPVVDFLFTEVDLSSSHFQEIITSVQKAIVSSHCFRYPPHSLQHLHFRVLHAQCGGVMNGVWSLNLYSKGTYSEVNVGNYGRCTVGPLLHDNHPIFQGKVCPPPRRL